MDPAHFACVTIGSCRRQISLHPSGPSSVQSRSVLPVEWAGVNPSQPRMPSPSLLRFVVAVATAMSLTSRVAAQMSIVPDGSAVGSTRFELQRGLLEIDEQRRRLEVSLEPVDSVLRVFAHDTARIAGFSRPSGIDGDVARVVAAMRDLRVAPDSSPLVQRFIDAVSTATRNFTAAESSLGGRLLTGAAAQDYLVRSPHAAIVPLTVDLPPRDSPVWDKIRRSDYGKQPLPRITFADLRAFSSALSGSGFQAYRSALLGAFTKRMAEIRQTRDSGHVEIDRLRRKAMELAHAIGAADDSAGRAQAHAVNVGLPVFAVVFITLLLAPRAYKSPELQQWIFTSGILLEITTLVLIVAGLLVLALAGKVSEAVIGTVMGGVLGYGVGRGASKRVEVPMTLPTVSPAAMPAATPVSVPIGATGRRI
jgi:hypothetical protein